MSSKNPESQNKSKEVSFFETSDSVVESLVKNNPENDSTIRRNLSELWIWNLEKADPQNINEAIKTRLDTEVNKIWKWHNLADVNNLKNEFLNNITKIDNKEEKLKAYCDFLEWLKDDVWAVVKSQYIQNKDYQKNQQIEQKQNQENQSFFEKWNKLRSNIQEHLDSLKKKNIKEYNTLSSRDCIDTLSKNDSFNEKYCIDYNVDLNKYEWEWNVFFIDNLKKHEIWKINFQESTFNPNNPNGWSQKTKFHNADSLQKAIEETMEFNA